ncbi:MAG: transposase [Acidobacteria bacterium]|nr:transposase [Acidobacteriota bacterium]
MRNYVQGAKGKAGGRPPGANGAAGTGKERRKRRRWSVEEKIRIARESLASNETITAVAERHGVPRNRLSAWRGLLRQGKLVAPPSKSPPLGAFAALEVEERPSVVIEGRGVTVRLEGAIDTAGIVLIAAALAGRR